MAEQHYDLVVRNARIATAERSFDADIGIRDGVIVALEQGLAAGEREIDAAGRWVLPGGVDSHCHVEQLSGMGLICADDFHSATVSAAFGGNTTIIPFAAQHRQDDIPEVLDDYARRAREKAVIDYAFHLIVTRVDEQALKHDIPQAIRDGITSIKVFMTYARMKLDDYSILELMSVADREGALMMVHAENDDVIRWLADRLTGLGHQAPKYHAVAHAGLAENEAAHRAICLSRLLDTPLVIVHVSERETVECVRRAQVQGARIIAESCPQYLFLTAEDIDRPGVEGAKYCCSPPPRDEASQQAVWSGLEDGTLTLYSSDHAPYRWDESGKLPKGEKTGFREMANGLPGLEVRMPLLFSEGVRRGRISINQFVELTATRHARTYGLYPRKGTIAVGSDADLAIWDADREVTISVDKLHDAVDYTPYEGMKIVGWPETVINRGRIVIDKGELLVERGSGEFLPCATPEPVIEARQSRPADTLIRRLVEAR
ncbi:dihydropyrimidinase [Halotalea alkalilenta]|uniref:Dihydropyrimidinase n=1 Tax=Halotalea alkalilenta TaxID=376489 RepID=A0A172YD00_9GAMM|nr:dihydropyrimidinase [Halotalea alkalilenta]ANF57129.1 dihydropyrimidinase [Halotalea alkalilenta]